jgi:hypothetical protein
MHSEKVLAEKGGFLNKCVKNCACFKIAPLQSRLENDCVILYFPVKTNLLQMGASNRIILGKFFQVAEISTINIKSDYSNTIPNKLNV